MLSIKTQRNMRYFNKLVGVFVTIIIFTFSNCKKQTTLNQIPTGNSKDSPISPYVFNWETATSMPVSPLVAIPIYLPWQGTVGGVDGNIVNDYKSADGWRLVWNTFGPNARPDLSTQPGGYYFALYNVFRGILRFYLYIPPGFQSPSSYIAHGLSLYPNLSTSSSMLNFMGTDIIDLSSNKTNIVKTSGTGVNFLGSWLSMDYEIAYDPNIANQVSSNVALQWNTAAVGVTTYNLAGSGTTTGTVSTPAGGFDLTSTLGNLTTGLAEISGLNQLSLLKNASDFQKNATSAVGGALGNTVSGFFSGILGGIAGNSTTTDVNLKTSFTVTGSGTTPIQLNAPHFPIPGESDQQTANLQIPNYTSTMGVFNCIS
jgi:hypothetical protein